MWFGDLYTHSHPQHQVDRATNYHVITLPFVHDNVHVSLVALHRGTVSCSAIALSHNMLHMFAYSNHHITLTLSIIVFWSFLICINKESDQKPQDSDLINHSADQKDVKITNEKWLFRLFGNWCSPTSLPQWSTLLFLLIVIMYKHYNTKYYLLSLP